jgi:hypothetical protein
MIKDPEMQAYLQSLRLEATADYVRRGRLLAEIDDEELRGRWVGLFRSWVMTDFGAGHDHRQREDVESELQLRGKDPPFDRVPDEMAAMSERSKSRTDAMLRNPELAERLAQKINVELAAFRTGIKSAN